MRAASTAHTPFTTMTEAQARRPKRHAPREGADGKDKVATPAFQEYYSGAIGLDELRKRLEDDGNPVLARYSGVGGSLYASLRRDRPKRRVDAAFRAARLDRGVLVGEVSPERWLRLREVLAP